MTPLRFSTILGYNNHFYFGAPNSAIQFIFNETFSLGYFVDRCFVFRAKAISQIFFKSHIQIGV